MGELKTFSRPNLDQGNRFFEDTKNILSEFNPGSQTLNQEHQKVNNFSGYKKHPVQNPNFVAVTHQAPFGSRSYNSLEYTPKKYNTRPKTAVAQKYKQIKYLEKEKNLIEQTTRNFKKESKVTVAKKTVTFSEKKDDGIDKVFEVQISPKKGYMDPTTYED